MFVVYNISDPSIDKSGPKEGIIQNVGQQGEKTHPCFMPSLLSAYMIKEYSGKPEHHTRSLDFDES